MVSPRLSIREQSALRDEWLATRLDTVIPAVMQRAGIDCWVLVAREYNEDPVVATMLPSTWITARRRTILVFTGFGEQRIAIARYAVGSAFTSGWSPDDEPDQWRRLATYLEEINPQRIGINWSGTSSLADGLSASEHASLVAALPRTLRERVEPTDELAVGWLETRIREEMEHYPEACRRAHTILRRALSAEVITPENTTTDDVEWWLREEVAAHGYGTWFHPTVSVQRLDTASSGPNFSVRTRDQVILPGDLVHIDFGIVHLGLHTDQQQHAYVLRPGETEPPAGLRAGLVQANRLQDILMGSFATGKSGNDLLATALERGSAEGIAGTIYSHPIGTHGHGAGPTIGLWDRQAGVPGAGDYLIWPSTAYSIELSIGLEVPEWEGQQVRIMLEEDAFFDGNRVGFMDGRQTEFWLI